MTDIVERLRSPEFADVAAKYIMAEAAAEIERLRGAENDAAEWVEERTKRLRAEIGRLTANIGRLTANPADYRYWEGRYRDEAADNERLRAALLKITKSVHGSFDDAHVMADIARDALDGKDD